MKLTHEQKIDKLIKYMLVDAKAGYIDLDGLTIEAFSEKLRVDFTHCNASEVNEMLKAYTE